MKFFNALHFIFQLFLDALFPKSAETDLLFTFSNEKAYETLPPAPQTPFNFIISIFAYKNPLVKNLIWNIKYKKSQKALEIGGFAFFKKISTLFDLKKESVLIVPIPISQKRRNERGFNQCELILDEIIKLDIKNQILFSKQLLKRKVHKDRQTLKNRAERLADAKQIFELDQIELEKINKASGSTKVRVLVIDDVVTTGSTIKEAVDLLRSAGFGDTTGISLAH
jgi:competence protein ComFC